MKSKVLRLMLTAAIVILSGTWNHALAQTDSGKITGQVLDAKGASIPGATISVRNEGTNDERTTMSGTDGTFQFVALRPAFYTIKVTADQFAPAEQTGVQLTVGQEVRRTFDMQLATLTSTISVVESIESAIDTTSARLGVNINKREVSELPLNGRQVSQLFLQAPGAQNTGSGTFNDIRFSGASVEQNAVRYDGIEGGGVIDSQPGVLNAEIPTPFRLQSSLENVQEFRVESNNYPAEYGTGSGGQVSVITKSGTNSFHGSLYEYFRNDKLDAHNYFDTAANPSPLRLNQFGASLGGPIVKDKLFAYGYYEGYRLRSGINYREAVPSAAVRGLPACGSPGAPAFTASFPYGCANAAIQPLLAGFVSPNAVLIPSTSGGSTTPNIDIVQLNSVTRLQENSGGLRLDYKINNSNTLYARYFRDQGNWNYPEGVTGRQVAVVDNPQNGVLSLQSTFGSNLINEAKVGFNESLSQITGIAPTVNGVDFSAISINFSGAVVNGGGTNTGAANPGGLIRASSAANGRAQPYTPYTISLIDNVSWIAGKHNVKFGAEVRLVRIYADRLGGTTYTFANVDSLVANTLTSTAYLSDLSSTSPYNGATGNRLLKQEMYIGYIQDEVKLRPNLTLNYGLRYEYYAPMREDRNLSVYLDAVTGQLSCASTDVRLCQNPTRSNWYKADPTNFGPRIGIAWSPFSGRTGTFSGERTVFRAGFGIFSGPGQAEDTIQPTVDSDRVSSTVSGGSYCGTAVGCATSPAAITNNFLTNPLNRSAQPRAYAPDYLVPERDYQYSASWQQQWGGKFVSTVAYVGTQGRNLFLRNVTNRIVSIAQPDQTKSATVIRQFSIVTGDPTLPAPNTGTVQNPFAEVDFKTSGGHDAYNALQTQLVRRSNNGLTLSAQYTFAKSFGNSTGSNEARTVGNPANYEYDNGYNLFDVRHAFNVSALYDLPVGHGKQYMSDANGIANAVLGGWQVGSIVSARTGFPVEIYVTRPDVVYKDASGLYFTSAAAGRTAVINTPGGGSSRAFRRPDLVSGVNPFLSNGALNPAAFSVPVPGTFGNLQRGSIHGPGAWQADLTLQKTFPVRESVNVQFRAEIYNLFNHPNFANPPGTIAPTFGALPSAGGSANNTQPGQPLTATAAGNGGAFGKFNQTLSTSVGTGANRQIQFALRLNF
jgi:hypothetical protein